MVEKALKQPDLFLWTGTDKRGVKVKGQTEAVTRLSSRPICASRVSYRSPSENRTPYSKNPARRI